MDRRRRRGAFGLTLALLCALVLTVTPGVARADTTIDVAHCDQTDLQNAINAGGTVTFSADCTIELSGPLDLSAGALTIDGSGHTVVLDGQSSTRIFDNAAPTGDYTLSHLTLEHGYVGGGGNGGAIEFLGSGNLTLSHDTFIDNEVGSIENGGAVDATYLTVTGSTFTGNSAGYGGQGGAVYIEDNGGLTAADDTFSGNSVGLYGEGGAVLLGSSTFNAIGTSTFSGNSTDAGGYGGAIATLASTEISLSTLSGNSVGASGYGNAIADLNVTDSDTLEFSTISGNTGGGASAVYDGNGIGFTIDYTLFSANGTDCGGAGGFSDGSYNFTDTDGTSCGFSAGSPFFDTVSTDAHLAPLGDYGGPTQTMALQATSPAFARNGGANCGNSTDQRGFPQDPSNCSIGAYAYDAANQFIGTCDETTLDAAVSSATAQADYGATSVKFGCDGTITLTSSISVPTGGTPGSRDVTLDGNGHSVTIDGGGDGLADCTGVANMFDVGTLTFTLKQLTLAHACGNAVSSSSGGSNITIANSLLEDNYGTIHTSGYFTATNTTFANNLVDQQGAAVNGFNSPITLTGDTFVNNTDVEPYVDGAAVRVNNATVTLQNDLFYGNGNVNSTGTRTNCYTGGGSIVDNGSNFTDNGASDGCGFSEGAGDVLGTDPQLGPLADNGGPTQTMAITQLSPPAVADAQDDCGLSQDQRGVSRQTGNCSIGAYQYDATNQTISTCDEAHLDNTVAIAARDTSAATVTFGGDCTILLNSAVTLPDGANVTIDGNGHDVVLDGQNSTRIFDFEQSSGSLTLDDLTLQNGNAGSHNGGAVEFTTSGTLTIAHSTLLDNSTGNGLTGLGGAVDATNFAISDTTFSGNTAGRSAGGLLLAGGTGTLTDDTFSSNSNRDGTGAGGAFDNNAGTATIDGTTFDGNSAAGAGGAIYSEDATDTITNSTFSGNSDSGYGSAIASFADSGMTLENDTFVGNSGAAAVSADGSVLEVGWTLFAGNGTDCSAPVTTDDGYNLTDSDGTSCGFSAGSNDTLSTDAHLDPLADNGGPTQTMALTEQSPPIATDTHADCGLSTDQRGVHRNGVCSIGAYQYDTTSQTVSTCDDATAYGAMEIAANGESPSTVTFACDGTIDLSSPVTFADGVDVTIDGTGHDVVLDGQGSTRIFDDENPSGNLTLTHLTLQHGHASCGCGGGAIEFYTSGTLTITGSTFLDNSVDDGAIGGAVDAANLVIEHSTFRGNSAGDFGAGGGVALEGGSGTLADDSFSSNSVGAEGAGGAFFDYGGTSTISATTFDGNSAAFYGEGGAIFGFANSTDTITNSTFSGNFAGSDGSAIFSYFFSSATLASDTVVGNTGGASAVSSTYNSSLEIGSTLFAGNGTDCYTDGPSIADAGYNLAEDGSCGFADGVNNDIISSTPRVMPLGNYGGLTETVALQSTSPAVDAGSCAASAGVDQRGVSRPQGGSCDIGAYEASPVAPATSLQLSPASPTGRNGWYTTAPQATLTSTNPNSATVSTFYGVNDPSCESAGTCTSYSAPFSLTDGLNTLSYYSQDDTPAFEGANTRVVKVDTTAPTSSLDLHGYAAGSWTNSDVTFSVSGSDATSGLAYSYYAVDQGSQTRASSSPVTLSAEGKHTVWYRSTDIAGNVEAWNSASVRIDKTAPLLSGAPTTSPNVNGWYHGNVTIKWSCSDALSGIASCPANSTISTEGGSLTASATDFDAAGNSTSATSSPAVNIDKTAPTTAGVLSTSGYQSAATYEGPVTLTLTPSDSLSGVDTTYYSIDGGSAQVYSAPVSFDTSGVHRFRFWSTDLAGNVELQHLLTFNLIHKPSAPSLGSLTRGVRSLGVAWSVPADTGGSPISSYLVTYVNQTTSVSATQTVPGSQTSTTLTGLSNGTSYSVTVTARNAAGAGGASSAQIESTYGLPDAPVSFVPTLADGGASLSWQPGAADGGTPVTSYALTITGGGGSTSQSFDPATACDLSGCSGSLSGLTNGVRYVLRLWSVNAAGKSSSYALAVVTPYAVPGRPTSVAASGGAGSVGVTWEPPSQTGGGVVSYQITLTGGASPVVKTYSASTACAGDPCSATVNGLAKATTYTVTVKAVNPAGASAASTSSQATTDSTPGLPNSFTAVPGSGSADLSWHAPTSDGGSPVTGYRLRVYNGNVLINTISISCTTASCTYTLTGLTSGTTYGLSLNAINAVGSGPSASIYVKPS